MLKKLSIGMFVILALFLAACSGTSDVEATPTVGEVEAPTAAPQGDPSPAPTTAAEVTEEEPATVVDPSCVPNPPKPTPSDEIMEVFGPDPETDWIKGPEDAAVTIVEYGDFQ